MFRFPPPSSIPRLHSVSALQWLFYSVKRDHKSVKRLTAFFTALYRSLRRGARAALQIYPQTEAQLELVTSVALSCGFTGGLVVDFPNSTKAKKQYLVLIAGRDGAGRVGAAAMATASELGAVPRGVGAGAAGGGDEEDEADDESDEDMAVAGGGGGATKARDGARGRGRSEAGEGDADGDDAMSMGKARTVASAATAAHRRAAWGGMSVAGSMAGGRADAGADGLAVAAHVGRPEAGAGGPLGDAWAETAATAVFETRRPHIKRKARREREARVAPKSKAWILKKKEARRRKGLETRPDTKYTGRRRPGKF